MNTTNSILLELKESSITKILNGLKCLDDCGIAYKIIEDTPAPPREGIYNANTHYLASKKAIGSKGLEVLDLLSKGKSYNQIAEGVDISVDGVRYYIKKIFKALGVNNGRDAVRVYLTEMKTKTAS